MGQTMGHQNNGVDHGVPEQWGRPWGTRTMGQTMGYQNNGADNGLFEGSIMFCSNKFLISSLK